MRVLIKQGDYNRLLALNLMWIQNYVVYGTEYLLLLHSVLKPMIMNWMLKAEMLF